MVRNYTISGSQIFLHGSMTNFAGQSTIFGGTSGTVTTLNYAAAGGGQPWEMICATIPASWTASGCLNKRLRWTSGANIDDVIWIIKDLGGAAPNARARLCDGQSSFPMTAPVATTSSTFTPVAGDTFVVETLTNIPNLVIDLIGGETATINNGVILDSLDLSGGDTVLNGSRAINAYGCTLGLTFSRTLFGAFNTFGCQYASGSIMTFFTTSINNSYCNTDVTIFAFINGVISRFMTQGGSLALETSTTQIAQPSVITGWSINQIGFWDTAAAGRRPLTIFNQTDLAAGCTLWGNGNTNNNVAPIALARGASLMYGAASTALPAAYFFLLSASAGAENGAFIACYNNASVPRVNVPAYDDATQLFTANRLLSPANLQATVAAGGFGGYFFDPVTTCSMGQV